MTWLPRAFLALYVLLTAAFLTGNLNLEPIEALVLFFLVPLAVLWSYL